jgi:hypothetical protein
LLRRLELAPGGWKRCALAFIDSQRLANSLKAIMREPAHEAADDITTGLLDRSMAEPQKKRDVVTRCGADGQVADGRRSRLRWLPHAVWSAAAMVLLVLGISIGRNQLQPAPNRNDSLSNSRPANLQPPGIAILENSRFVGQIANADALRQICWSLDAVKIPDVEVVAIVDACTSGPGRFLPVIKSSELEKQIGRMPRPQLPLKIDRDLRRAGWSLDTQRQLIALTVQDCDQRLMPIDSLNCQFVGRPVY